MRSRILNRFTGSSDKITKAVEGVAGLHTAHKAVMVDDAAKVLAQARRQVSGHAKSNEIGDGREEGDGMIHVGDQVIYNESKPSGVGGLAKLALGAGLLATGIGAPVAAYMLKDYLLPKPVPAPTFEDREKDFGIRFFEPKETN